MFGGQPVVHRDHDAVPADRVLTGGDVVGVEVAEGETAAVEEHRHRMWAGSGIILRPVHPHRDRPGRPGDVMVLHPQFGVHLPARQVTQPLTGLLDPAVGGQLERHRFQYLLQDGVNG